MTSARSCDGGCMQVWATGTCSPWRRSSTGDGSRREPHGRSLERRPRPLPGRRRSPRATCSTTTTRCADAIVPHLRDRPFTMKRWREGLPAALLPEAGAEGHARLDPDAAVPDLAARRAASRLVDFPLVNSREALLWMVQMHCIDMNAWYSRVDKPDRPDFVLFDLDPPDEPGRLRALRPRRAPHPRRARRARARSYVKTSGADGIHVLVPIARRATATTRPTSSPSCSRAGSRPSTRAR